MRRFFIFTFLLAAIQFDRLVFGERNSHVGDKLEVTIEIPQDVKIVQSTAIFNGPTGNEENVIFPDGEGSRFNFVESFGTTFSFRFRNVTTRDFGRWTIVTDYEKKSSPNQTNQQENTIDIYEIKSTNLIPTSNVNAIEGQYVDVSLDPSTVSNAECQLINKNEEKLYKKYSLAESNSTEDDSEEIQRYKNGQCGFRIRVRVGMSGTWTIVEKSKYTKRMAELHLEVERNIPTQKDRQKWYKNSSGIINKPFTGKAIYCELQRPDRQNISLKAPECSYETKAVSESHAGTWILRYGLKNSMELIQRELTVEVLDPQNVEVHVDYNRESINMSCVLPFADLTYCIFTRPDKTVIVVPQAVGNDRYEFSGSSYNDLPEGQRLRCGLTIRKPTNDDYGAWKCTIGSESFGESNAFVIVERDAGERKHRTLRPRGEHTYVKRGDSFQVKCSIEAKLDYCWMRSPNGSIYSVTKDGSQPNSLRYTGEGLVLGVCGAIVENADDTHAGDWSCQLGVHGSTEVESIVPVTVTESYLYSDTSAVMKTDGKWSEILHCYTFPKAEATIDYCRWVSPDHRGIYGQELERYKLTTTPQECILESKRWKDEDFGQWTCYARLSNGLDDEVYSTVELHEIYSNGYGYWTLNNLAILFLLMCLIGAAIGFYKKKSQKNDDLPPMPPPYAQSCGMSKEEIIEKGDFR